MHRKTEWLNPRNEKTFSLEYTWRLLLSVLHELCVTKLCSQSHSFRVLIYKESHLALTVVLSIMTHLSLWWVQSLCHLPGLPPRVSSSFPFDLHVDDRISWMTVVIHAQLVPAR